MLIAGIIGCEGKTKIANLINSILSSRGKKVSIVDSSHLMELDSKRIKCYLHELEKNNVHILILKINMADIENRIFNDFHFDIIIYTDKPDGLNTVDIPACRDLTGRVYSLLDEKGIVILNVDDVELVNFIQDMKYHVVTYGFNSKASITTSSIGDMVSEDGFMCCLQKTIAAKNGMVIEPQEYRITMESGEFNTYNILAAASFAIVNGVDLNCTGH